MHTPRYPDLLTHARRLICCFVLGLSLPIGASAAQKRPNILFAIADDWSYGHAGAYGCAWVKTPAFDRVASHGVLFRNAYTPNAKCAPSRACILTGRNSWQLEAGANHTPFFPPQYKTFMEALGENGYFVGHTAKGWGPGIATNQFGKPRLMTGSPFNARSLKPPSAGISANDYSGNFRDFLEAAPKDKPWCFWYGALEPHRGYEYGSGVAKGGKQTAMVDRVPGFWPDTEIVRNDMLDYGFEVEHFDTHLGRMLAELDKRGMLSNTLVVVTSDHGMPFPRAKGQAYRVSNHVPLAMMWPARIARLGREIDDYVSFIDLAPTFVELAGIAWTQTGMPPATGRSLASLISTGPTDSSGPARNFVLIGKERHDVGRPNDWGYPIRGILKDGLLYLRNYETNRWPAGNPETGYLNCDGGATKTLVLERRRANATDPFWALCFGKRPAEELYDTRKDPDCIRNLAGDPSHAKQRAELEAILVRELKAQNDPRMAGQGAVFDEYPYANAGNKNFHERFMKGEKLKAGWVNPSDFEKKPLD